MVFAITREITLREHHHIHLVSAIESPLLRAFASQSGLFLAGARRLVMMVLYDVDGMVRLLSVSRIARAV